MKNVGDSPATYLVFEFHGSLTEPDRFAWTQRLRGRMPEPAKQVGRKVRALVRD